MNPSSFLSDGVVTSTTKDFISDGVRAARADP